MKNGIILEIKKDKVIVINKEGQFDAIKFKKGMNVGQEIKYSENSIHRINKIAACLVVGFATVVTVATYNIYNTPTTYIAFGSSSDVELTANSFGRIISTNIKNKSGQTMLNSSNFLNKDITEASVAIVQMANRVGFIDNLNEDNTINLVVINEDEQNIDNITKKICSKVDDYLKSKEIPAQMGNKLLEEVEEKDLKEYKNYLISVVGNIDKEITEEIAINMTICELNNIIRKYHMNILNNIKEIDSDENNIKEFNTYKDNILNKNRTLQETLGIAN